MSTNTHDGWQGSPWAGHPSTDPRGRNVPPAGLGITAAPEATAPFSPSGPVPMAWASNPGHPIAPVSWTPPSLSPQQRRARWPWVLGIVLGVLFLFIGLLVIVGANSTMTVTGTATVRGMSGYVSVGAPCEPTATSTLTSVVINDASGAMVGTTTLPPSGIAVNTGGYSSYADACRYAFTVPDVPATSDFYRVKVGNGIGEGVPFSADDMREGRANVVYGY